jgi:hypothetical protein
MNWMFWKKRTETGDDDVDDGGSSRQLPEEETSGQEDTESEAPESEEQEPEAPENRGPMMRLKEWFAASAHGFKKTDASDEETDQDEEADSGDEAPSHDAHESRDHADADQESADEQPDSLGLAARIKMQFAALMRRFRKEVEPDTEAEGEEEHPSEKTGRGDKDEPESVPEEEGGEVPPKRAHNYLLIGGVSVLLIMVLTGFGFIIWKVFMTHPVQHTVTPGITDPTLVVRPQVVPRNVAQEAEIEELRKKNMELQMQIEAARRAQPQAQQTVQPTRPMQPVYQSAGGETSQATGGAASSSGAGGLAISTKDPKAAAMGLKEAIDAMNAANGGAPAGKPQSKEGTR